MARKAKPDTADYPLMLYREGGRFLWDGRQLDTLIANDADEESAALGDGWVRSFGDDA